MRKFVNLPIEEQTIDIEGVLLQVAGKEVCIHTPPAVLKMMEREELHRINDAAITALLPFEAPIRKRGREDKKSALRRWLNRNLTHRWSMGGDCIRFESDLDATCYKLFWV